MTVNPDRITEFDVEDPEVAEFSPWVTCEWNYTRLCRDHGRAIDMVKTDDGWACWACFSESQSDALDALRTARGW